MTTGREFSLAGACLFSSAAVGGLLVAEAGGTALLVSRNDGELPRMTRQHKDCRRSAARPLRGNDYASWRNEGTKSQVMVLRPKAGLLVEGVERVFTEVLPGDVHGMLASVR